MDIQGVSEVNHPTQHHSDMTDPAIDKKKKPSSPTVPNALGEACAVGGRVAAGMEAHGSEAGIQYATAADLRAAIHDALTAEDAYQAVLGKRLQANYPAFRKADAEGRAFIQGAKKVLSLHLGDTWNQSWSEPGFLGNSLRTPVKLAEREALLQALARYFAAHPECEAPGQGITAARASAVHQAVVAARRNVDAGDTVRKNLRARRDQAARKLRRMLSGIIGEIRNRLPIDSPWWDSFGLTAPKPRPRGPRASTRAGIVPTPARPGTPTERIGTPASNGATAVGLES
jgi:hypothetical protein